MARTGRIWHTNLHHRRASFPRDICVRASHRYEVIAVAPGPKWQAVGLLGYSVLHRIKAKRQILSPQYRRTGIAMVGARGRYYLTVDLLG
jgi:hypothetical protein